MYHLIIFHQQGNYGAPQLFFGQNIKPTSSKDPFALRRLALGIVRIIIENKKDFKIRDLINYSSSSYHDQGFEFENKSLQRYLESRGDINE